VTNREVFVKSPGGVVVASREVNQYFAINSEKQRCLADVINLLGVVLIRPSGGRSVLIYLDSTYGPMTSDISVARQAAVGPILCPY